MTDTLEDKVNALVQKAVENFDPKAIITFGSVDRGTATEDSDLDVAIITKQIFSGPNVLLQYAVLSAV